jgi:beta-lactamase regulating signal transducer with metallopeptidase domain
MKKTNFLKTKKKVLLVMVCFAIAISLVIFSMVSAYGEDESDSFASTSINIHGADAPDAPASAMLQANEEADMKTASNPLAGTDAQNIILWISLVLTGSVIVVAAYAIRRMEK